MENHLPAAASGAANPDAPPGVGSDDEAKRRDLLATETAIRYLGLLWWGGGVLYLLLAAVFLLAVPLGGDDPAAGGAGILALAIVLCGALGAAHFWAGRGLRRFDPRVRTLSVVLLVLGLLDFPLRVWPAAFRLPPTLDAPLAPSSILFGFAFGTIFSLYFLWLLLGQKGKRVLTTEYQRIVAATPHIRYLTPLWEVCLAVVLLGALLALVIAAVV